MKAVYISCVFFFLAVKSVQSQIIISLLLGDKLNSGKVEFGLDGGLTVSDLQGLEGAKPKTGFNLGFYFDIRLNHPKWIVHTGVIVKGPVGAKGIPVYLTGIPETDSLFEGSTYSANLSYFYVPAMMKYQVHEHFFVSGGFQIGLLHKAFDEFNQTVEGGGDLKYTIKNREDYHRIDAGLSVGVGYRILKGNGMNLTLSYYYGLTGILKSYDVSQSFNRVFYTTIGIPIGKKRSAKKESEQTIN